jgi:FHA domain
MEATDCAALRYTDNSGKAQCVVLDESRPRLLIGRSTACDVVIGWDVMVSREHAILELIGAHWFVSDDGMSTYGTYVRSERASSAAEQQVRGRRRLEANDRLLLGRTVLTFRPPIRSPAGGDPATTRTRQRQLPRLTEAQGRVLVALCAPLMDDPNAMPAQNQEIVAGLCIGVDAVKDHLHELYQKFGVQDLPRGEKRIRLAQLAVRTGHV